MTAVKVPLDLSGIGVGVAGLGAACAVRTPGAFAVTVPGGRPAPNAARVAGPPVAPVVVR